MIAANHQTLGPLCTASGRCLMDGMPLQLKLLRPEHARLLFAGKFDDLRSQVDDA
jgi:hypothetical protein